MVKMTFNKLIDAGISAGMLQIRSAATGANRGHSAPNFRELKY